MAPTVTSSPSRAPARARARSTPRRRSRRTASACAPSSLRSDSATARSAAAPDDDPGPGTRPLHGHPLGDGAVHHDLARRRPRPPPPAPRAPGAPARSTSGRDADAGRGARARRSQTPFVVRSPTVGLAAHHDTGALEELGPVRAELGQQDAPLRRRRLPTQLGRAEVEQHDQHPGTLDVAQELVAEALALRGALDQAGDVGHDELGAVAPGAQPDHAEMRLQRGERVVRDLRLGGRHGRDQRRLPRVGEPDQRHVGHQLELHVQPELLALLALLGERGRPAAVGEEARVAPPALAALGHHEAGALHGQVAHHGAARGRARPCPRAPGPPGPCPVRRAAWIPSRARRRWRGGTDGPGSRAVTTRSPRRPATRRRRGPRHRRPDRPGRHGPRGATTPPRLPRRRRARAVGPGRRIRAWWGSLRAEQAAGALSHLGAGPFAVDHRAPSRLDDAPATHPHVGHQVAGAGPHEVAEQLGVGRPTG